MFRWLLKTFLFTLLLLAIGRLLWPNVYISGFWTAFFMVVVLQILKKTVYPVLNFLSFPINLLTLGLFRLVLNGFVFAIADWLLGERVWISSFGYCVLLAAIYSLCQWLVDKLLAD